MPQQGMSKVTPHVSLCSMPPRFLLCEHKIGVHTMVLIESYLCYTPQMRISQCWQVTLPERHA